MRDKRIEVPDIITDNKLAVIIAEVVPNIPDKGICSKGRTALTPIPWPDLISHQQAINVYTI